MVERMPLISMGFWESRVAHVEPSLYEPERKQSIIHTLISVIIPLPLSYPILSYRTYIYGRRWGLCRVGHESVRGTSYLPNLRCDQTWRVHIRLPDYAFSLVGHISSLLHLLLLTCRIHVSDVQLYIFYAMRYLCIQQALPQHVQCTTLCIWVSSVWSVPPLKRTNVFREEFELTHDTIFIHGIQHTYDSPPHVCRVKAVAGCVLSRKPKSLIHYM